MAIGKLSRHLALLTLVSIAGLSISGCIDDSAAAVDSSSPPTVDTPPAGLVDLKPGQLLTAERVNGFPALDNADNFLVTYVSTSWTGRNTIVSGQIAIPRTPAPPDGYPVMSYGYGVRGQISSCAPSNAFSGDNSYFDAWIKRGYAVLRTDYEAFGTPGRRSNGNGVSNANTMADIVTAAHALDYKLRNDWIATGQSQGGGATVWATGIQAMAGGLYKLKGAIATSPTGPGIPLFMDDVVRGKPVAPSAQSFVAIVAMSAKVVDPSIDLDNLVAPEMKPIFAAMQKECFPSPIPGLQPGQYLKPGADYDKVAKFAKDQDPSNLTMQAPIFILQGLDDATTVTPPTTRAMVKALCSRSPSVYYKEYAGQGHPGPAKYQIEEILDFAESALAGTAPNNCS